MSLQILWKERQRFIKQYLKQDCKIEKKLNSLYFSSSDFSDYFQNKRVLNYAKSATLTCLHGSRV